MREHWDRALFYLALGSYGAYSIVAIIALAAIAVSVAVIDHGPGVAFAVAFTLVISLRRSRRENHIVRDLRSTLSEPR